MKSLTSGQIVDEYYGLGLKPNASLSDINNLLRQTTLAKASNQTLFIRSQLLVELARRREISVQARRQKAAEAAGLLIAKTPKGDLIVPHIDAEIHRTQVPILRSGWIAPAKERTAYNLRDFIMRSPFEGKDHGGLGDLAGKNLEALGLLILTYSGIDGLQSRPSLDRENRQSAPVEGKNYHWDITAISDGRIIETGEYRLQIKNRPKKVGHTDIIRINGVTQLGIDAHNFEDVVDVVKESHISQMQSRPTQRIAAVQAKLFDVLASHGPYIVAE